ncbi:MAG TPA: class I SAM-dependent methyltransferase [Flavobacteriales bacterium]|nr:class I SAM-dependent methyltransferase [Flavobacteriales bacterium]HIA12923.1 class I SAM-dependent methyltransferase [Flavobacteriales bacterium]HIO72359.1 class I SAM-dependent methyltransferase [Flavobacteriales bacterium]
MQPQEKVIQCYDATAEKYAAQFIDELSKKHFDSLLLKEFAAANKNNTPFADFGCGPGQTTKYLYDHGITDIVGIDISTEMIKTATNLFPKMDFETGDLLNLTHKPNSFGAAIAFYSIVHFTYRQVKIAFEEIHRVLKPNGEFLFSFHIGDGILHRDEFLEQPVDVDFYFFETEKIIELLTKTGYEIIDALERHPYEDVEYPSKRAYIWVGKTSNSKG